MTAEFFLERNDSGRSFDRCMLVEDAGFEVVIPGETDGLPEEIRGVLDGGCWDVCVLAHLDGRAVGCCCLYDRDGENIPIVCNKLILPDYRGRGMASQLNRQVLSLAEFCGFEGVKGGIPGVFEMGEDGLILADPEVFRETTGRMGGADSYLAMLNGLGGREVQLTYLPDGNGYWGIEYFVSLV